MISDVNARLIEAERRQAAMFRDLAAIEAMIAQLEQAVRLQWGNFS
jgi:hypothetical protein